MGLLKAQYMIARPYESGYSLIYIGKRGKLKLRRSKPPLLLTSKDQKERESATVIGNLARKIEANISQELLSIGEMKKNLNPKLL